MPTTPASYFGGAPNAFAGGMEFVAAQNQRRRRENALNALIERFGPEAAAPQELGVLEGISQRREMQPLVMAEARRADDAGRAMVDRYGPTAGDPTAHATDLDNRRRAGLGVGTFLQGVVSRGGDVGAAYDQIAGILPALGVRADQLGPVREMLVSDPEAVNDFVSMLRGESGTRGLSGGQAMYNNQTGQLEWVIPTETGHRTLEGYTPASAAQAEERLDQGAARLQQGWAKLSWDQAKALLPSAQPGVQYWMDQNGRVVADAVPGSPQEGETRAAREEREKNLRTSEEVLTGISEAAQRVGTFGNRALSRFNDVFLNEHGIIGANARRAQAAIPGTNAFEVAGDIENLKGIIAVNELLKIKRSGATLGQVSEKELEMLQNLLGRLDIARDPAALRDDVQEVLRMYGEIVRKSEGELETIRARRSAPEPGRYGPPVPEPGAAADEPSLEDLLQQYGQ